MKHLQKHSLAELNSRSGAHEFGDTAIQIRHASPKSGSAPRDWPYSRQNWVGCWARTCRLLTIAMYFVSCCINRGHQCSANLHLPTPNSFASKSDSVSSTAEWCSVSLSIGSKRSRDCDQWPLEVLGRRLMLRSSVELVLLVARSGCSTDCIWNHTRISKLKHKKPTRNCRNKEAINVTIVFCVIFAARSLPTYTSRPADRLSSNSDIARRLSVGDFEMSSVGSLTSVFNSASIVVHMMSSSVCFPISARTTSFNRSVRQYTSEINEVSPSVWKPWFYKHHSKNYTHQTHKMFHFLADDSYRVECRPLLIVEYKLCTLLALLNVIWSFHLTNHLLYGRACIDQWTQTGAACEKTCLTMSDEFAWFWYAVVAVFDIAPRFCQLCSPVGSFAKPANRVVSILQYNKLGGTVENVKLYLQKWFRIWQCLHSVFHKQAEYVCYTVPPKNICASFERLFLCAGGVSRHRHDFTLKQQ